MRSPEPPVESSGAVHSARLVERRSDARRRFLRRFWVHCGVFVLSYIFTAGVALLSVLMWVRADTLYTLVSLAILMSVVFVVCFAGLRLLILHTLLDEYPNREEDPGMEHHLGKSIAYSLLALVIAGVLSGFLITIVSADTTHHSLLTTH